MSKQPTHRLYCVQQIKRNGEERAQWLDIGAGWPHKDGEGLDLMVQNLPIAFFTNGGRLVLRKVTETPAADV